MTVWTGDKGLLTAYLKGSSMIAFGIVLGTVIGIAGIGIADESTRYLMPLNESDPPRLARMTKADREAHGTRVARTGIAITVAGVALGLGLVAFGMRVRRGV